MVTFQLNKESPVPLHTQLLNELRRAILTGEFRPHARIGSEPELARTLNISRTTIRQAWEDAEAEGLLYRVHGKGTYVAEFVKTTAARMVGFLIPNFWTSFDSQLLNGAEGHLREHGYRLMFSHTSRNMAEEDRLIREMRAEGVAGFLFWPAVVDGSARTLPDIGETPTVLIDRPIPGLDYPCVAADHYQGAVYAVQHLIDLGHVDIAFVSNPNVEIWSIAERLRGYEDTLRAAGLKPRPPILVGEGSEISTRLALLSYKHGEGREIDELQVVLRQRDRPTALFTANDLMALQVLGAARRVGLKVPAELSVVGFDDMDMAAHTEPPLTTILQDPQQVGAEAARVLLDMLGGNLPAHRTVLLPTRLVKRESTAPRPLR